MMRLLFLAPNPPWPTLGGGSLRMFHLARFLGERYEVDLVAPALEGAEEAERLLRGTCREVEFVPPGPGGLRRRLLRLGPYEKDPALADAIRRRLASAAYVAVQVEKPAMLPYVPRGTRIPIILDTFAYGLAGAWRALRHEAGLFTRARNLLRLVRFAAFDAFCWPAIHCLLVVSDLDRQRCLRERPGRNVLLVPNGVDCAVIRPSSLHGDSRLVLVFTGDMGFAPNVEAAVTLATRIFPQVRRVHPDAQLHLVGRNPDPRVLALRTPGITVTGEVPDMLPQLHAGTVYVAPLDTGAGTRTKLLEAMAAGLPVVTSRVGIEGIEAKPDRDIAIADGPEATAQAVLRLLANDDERCRLGAGARRLMEERYDWPQCLAPLEALYSDLLPRRPARC